MYKIDLSNKHKKKFIAYVIENGGNIVFVASDTRKKLVNWLQNSLGVYSFYMYDEGGKELFSYEPLNL